jgi:hypothetical protein
VVRQPSRHDYFEALTSKPLQSFSCTELQACPVAGSSPVREQTACRRVLSVALFVSDLR